MALNVAEIDPNATVTKPGVVKPATLLDSETTAPLAPAAFDSVTVQAEVPPVPTLVGVQESPLTTAGATSEIVAVRELPFRLAVTVAVWSVEMVPADAVNDAVAEPDRTVTDVGVVKPATLLDTETVVFPDATAFSETVQLDVAAETRDIGVQLNEANVGGTFAVTLPPVPVTVRPRPSAVLPRVFVTEIGAVVAVGATVIDTTATAPF